MEFSLFRWLVVVVAVLSLTGSPCLCWDQEELDLFDLVEEVGENFYDLMQLEQDASTSDIRRAYRQLSLQLHPDKNNNPNAAEEFRKMVAVADVLKDEVTREMYDIILEEGLPDWKEPLFYYRKMRKMGLMELSVMLVLVLSVGHYLYGWAVYAEKQIVLQDRLSRKQKRKSKHGKPSVSQQRLEAEVEMLNSEAKASIPHFKDLLPILMAKNLFWFSLLGLKILHKKWEMVLSSSVKVHKDLEEEVEYKKVRSKKPERRDCNVTKKGGEIDGNNDKASLSSRSCATKEGGEIDGNNDKSLSKREQVPNHTNNTLSKEDNNPINETGCSTTMESLKTQGSKDKDSKEAAIDTTKESLKTQGSEDRDSKEAKTAAISRRRKKTKSTVKDLYAVQSSQDSPIVTSAPTLRDDSLSCGGEACEGSSSEGGWSQFQQRQLELALLQFPKSSSDRWINIARCVPEKSQEECIVRCKQIYEELRRKKAS